MAPDKSSKEARGDPLAGWKKENLAAPKPAAPQNYGYQATVYDDRPGQEGPASLVEESASISKPQQASQLVHGYQASVYDDRSPVVEQRNTDPSLSSSLPAPVSRSQTMEISSIGKAQRGITEAEKAACPSGDTRWPPPKTAHTRPLQLVLDERGTKRVYYHLIYKNDAPEAKFWKKEIQSKARSFFAAKFPVQETPIDTANMSALQIQQAREQAEFEEKGRLRNAVVTAKLQKRMREVSQGARGTIWLLEEESIEVWKCIEGLQKGDPDKAVRAGAVVERFEIFGRGLKSEKDHVLLLGQRVRG